MSSTTPSQTVGPFVKLGLTWDDAELACAADAPGAIMISGRVLDGDGQPLDDAVVETWQTSPESGEGFRGFARSNTDDDGNWWVVTLKPAAGDQAPHLAVSVLARGLLIRLATRIYFADEAQANANDPVLALVPAERRATLMAQPADDGYRFDIHLQGPNETVFFDV